MLLLAIAALRAAATHSDISSAVLQGDCAGALRQAGDRLERLSDVAAAPAARAALGQLVGRLLLACGREEEAEERFRRQLKVYEGISRASVRWHGSLDQGAFLLHMNRPARALECFNVVADDRQADAAVRVEAMAGAAAALHRGGDWRCGLRALDAARRLLDASCDPRLEALVDCLALELAVLRRERASDSLDDHGLCNVYREGAGEPESLSVLRQQLAAAAGATAPLVSQRMRWLGDMLASDGGPVAAAARANDAIAWLKERKLSGFEELQRIEAALMLIARNASHAAAELLGRLVFDEQQVHRSRHALELQYCMSKLHLQQGRYIDALRLYRNHMQQVVHAVRNAPAQPRTPAFLEAAPQPQQGGDTAKMRLPLRYRRAYQYIIEHLNDESLSVRQVAAHVNVTERALQLAFRAHLGLTPAELIRQQRMERIRNELRDNQGEEGVLDVASRWGITNRSTLAHNYRASFAETPTQTLRGSTRPAA